MKRINDIIAEQFWSTMNATSQLKSMNKETFLLFLLDKMAYHNKAKIEEIKQEGWTFIPIEWCTKLRDIENEKATPISMNDLQEKRNKELEKIRVASQYISKTNAILADKAAVDDVSSKTNNKTASIGKKRKCKFNDDNVNKNKKRRK